jgi:ABC-type polysaccharide/polyol phosphate transport system ATPase subunit
MYAIKFENVSKMFRLNRQKHGTLKSFLTSLVSRGGRNEEFWALKDINFELEKGETLGLIGPNGSGKSTLLKVMTNILKPTKGMVNITGEVSGLLELGAGFHPDLTGRENIYLNGSILGFKKKEIDARYDEIVSFAGLSEFIEMPVKYYSLGMYMRLGFSIAINVSPDIFLIDEVFAVGDQDFQNKCLLKIAELKKRQATIIIVSHSMEMIRNFCTTCLFLDKGRIAALGPVGKVVDQYLASVKG